MYKENRLMIKETTLSAVLTSSVRKDVINKMEDSRSDFIDFLKESKHKLIRSIVSFMKNRRLTKDSFIITVMYYGVFKILKIMNKLITSVNIDENMSFREFIYNADSFAERIRKSKKDSFILAFAFSYYITIICLFLLMFLYGIRKIRDSLLRLSASILKIVMKLYVKLFNVNNRFLSKETIHKIINSDITNKLLNAKPHTQMIIILNLFIAPFIEETHKYFFANIFYIGYVTPIAFSIAENITGFIKLGKIDDLSVIDVSKILGSNMIHNTLLHVSLFHISRKIKSVTLNTLIHAVLNSIATVRDIFDSIIKL